MLPEKVAQFYAPKDNIVMVIRFGQGATATVYFFSEAQKKAAEKHLFPVAKFSTGRYKEPGKKGPMYQVSSFVRPAI
eukprot:SAG22_NODE_1244_length_5021_cov_16.855547_7_plen_77_part_00